METERIAIFGDVHANAPALAAVLKVAVQTGFDRLIFLGDLLSYGCTPCETADLLADAVAHLGAEVISGNHDQIYFDLAAGRGGYFSSLPAWLRESVIWTVDTAKNCNLGRDFHWRDSIVIGETYLAHANPHPYGNWSYLNSAEEFSVARDALPARVRLGIFGHTHRSKFALFSDGRPNIEEIAVTGRCSRFVAFPADPALITLAATGQPRGGGKDAQLLLLTVRHSSIECEFVAVPYDVDRHCRAISQSTLSADCKAKLIGFFR